ncbi:MAG: acetylglutamate kinase [Micrococcales bacterium]|nr:MAG: acetylglutamate kinase [Micrococcales bacterium]PIE27853.1 MAG: acetylglutamate kinase [Micrococcales bacterium]
MTGKRWGTVRVMRRDDPQWDATRAEILTDALPWLKEFHGQIVVIKYGGNAMVDEDLKRAFAQDMIYLRHVGIKPVVVHGGGPQVSSMLDRLNIPSEFRGGLRVTTPEAVEVVRMVLVGQVGRELVNLINADTPHAVGLSGEDAGLLRAERTQALVEGQPVDLGLVGDVVSVSPEWVLDLLGAGRMPVISSVAPDGNGNILNVNADTAAASLAVSLGAVKMVMLTDVEGLYADYPDPESLVQRISVSELESVLPEIDSGMRPKMQAALRAVQGGVRRATVIDGRLPHALLLEMLTSEGTGTMVVPA